MVARMDEKDGCSDIGMCSLVEEAIPWSIKEDDFDSELWLSQLKPVDSLSSCPHIFSIQDSHVPSLAEVIPCHHV
jgi:hypothetical protein